MKKITTVFLASIMLLSIPVFGSADSAVSAQSVATKSKRKGRYVVRRTWDGTKWTTRKVRVGTRSPRKKTWRTGRKVVSRTKKIFR